MWFAWKYLPLWYQQQRNCILIRGNIRCDLLENIYLCGINNNFHTFVDFHTVLWFAWKYLPLWYQQQPSSVFISSSPVVICLKISTFVVSTTTRKGWSAGYCPLWFAWKYLPLWYQQQLIVVAKTADAVVICLKISTFVVSTTTKNNEIAIKISLWFAWKYLPLWYQQQLILCNLLFIKRI